MIINSLLISTPQKSKNNKTLQRQAGNVNTKNLQAGITSRLLIVDSRANSLSFGVFNPKKLPVLWAPKDYRSEYKDHPGEIMLRKMAKENAVMDAPNYKRTAEQVALYLSTGPNKNMVIPDGMGNNPEILAHKFSKMLINGDFKAIGMTPKNTNVKLINPSKMYGGGKAPDTYMDDLLRANEQLESEKKPIEKQILFVENMADFAGIINQRQNSSLAMNLMFNSEKHKHIHIVGFMPKGIYDEKTNFSSPRNSREKMQWLTDKFKKYDLVSLGSNDAKDLLKNTSIRMQLLSENFKTIPFTEEAVDKAIDITSMIGGEFPKKAVDLMELTISDKRYKTGKDVDIINADDIEDTFKTHPQFREIAHSETKQFEVVQNPKKRLKDVGGIKVIKKKIQKELLDFIKDPDKYKERGAVIPKGFLLHGPPGTGKTLLAEAIAGEAGVPFIATTGSAFVEKYVGTGAARVRELFHLARAEARKNEKKTAIIFIDEIDTIGGTRKDSQGGGDDERLQTFNQLIAEMSGFDSEDDVNIVILAATNRRDSLDPALVRPGRFDREFEVPNPAQNKEARREIFEIHSKGKQFRSEEKKEILDEMAVASSGMSGADIENIMNIAAMATVDEEEPYITLDKLQEAKLQVQVGPPNEFDMPQWLLTEVVAHEFGHAICNVVMHDAAEKEWEKPNASIDVVCNESRGKGYGMVIYYPSDNTVTGFDAAIAKMVSSYGGACVEKMRRGGHADGVRSDIDQATKVATLAIEEWGLGPNVGMISMKERPYLRKIKAKAYKKDLNLFANTGEVISKKIVKFHKEFLNDYIKVYEKAKAENGGGNILSGKEFVDSYRAWIKAGGEKRQGKLKQLHADIRKIIRKAEKGVNPKLQKIKKAKIKTTKTINTN